MEELTKQVGDLEGMANVSFAWMVDRVRQHTGLKFDDDNLNTIVSRYMDNMGQVLFRQIKAEQASKEGYFAFLNTAAPVTFRGWGVGPIIDSFATQGTVMAVGGGSRTRIVSLFAN